MKHFLVLEVACNLILLHMCKIKTRTADSPVCMSVFYDSLLCVRFESLHKTCK